MLSNLSPKVLLIVAVTLDVAGGLLIVFSLPEGGTPLWFGVGLLAVGSLLMRTGINRMNAELEREDDATEPAATTTEELEPELKKLSPRPVQLTTRGKIVAAVWVVLIVISGALVYQHFNRLSPPGSKALLESEGESTTAVVNSKETRDAGERGTMYVIRYNFTGEDGAAIRSTSTVPRRVYDSLSEGEELEVIYFPVDPSINYLPSITSPVSTRAIWLLLAVLVGAAGFADAQRRTHRKLVSEGRAVSGFVADVRRRGGVRSFLVNYDVGGERRSLRASERNPALKNGQNATVLYDPGRIDRAVVYRLALYRAR